MPMPDLLSVPQAAAILGLSDAYMRRLVAAGRIVPVARVPAGALLDRADVERLVRERAQRPPRRGRPRIHPPRPPAAPREPVTACHRGHPYDEANTHRKADGTRLCRACDRIRKREARRRAAALAQETLAA